MKTSQPVEERAKDAVARELVKILHVPSIYFDAPWPTKKNHVDVLAIDRAGTGDVHVVEVSSDLRTAMKRVTAIMAVPAQFRWIAYAIDGEPELEEYDRWDKAALYAPKGMGRVGVIIVYPDEDPDSLWLEGTIAARAERFPGSYYEEADTFVARHKPDIMFR